MSNADSAPSLLLEETNLLRQEVADLKLTASAFKVQTELLQTLAMMERTANPSLTLKTILQTAMSLCNQFTQAEESSLFLLDEQGKIVDGILARGATIREEKLHLIGTVLEKGLAGWVRQTRQLGLVEDTQADERWLTLPNQPYIVRSALCVPLLKRKEIVGIVTLMHSQPQHFSPAMVKFMQLIAQSLALIFERALLNLEAGIEKITPVPQPSRELRSPDPQNPLRVSENLADLGLFIVLNEGKFLYANPKVAEIFGYSFGELIALESLCELVAPKNRAFVTHQINQCLQGQISQISCTFVGQCQGGKLIDVELSGSRTKLYGKSVAIGVMRAKVQ